MGFTSQDQSSVESTAGSVATYREDDSATSSTSSTSSVEDSAVSLAVPICYLWTSRPSVAPVATSRRLLRQPAAMCCTALSKALYPWEVMLPVSTWTQRYMQIGCGGLCGSIQMSVGAADGAEAIDNGNLAMGATDMDGGTDDWSSPTVQQCTASVYNTVM